MGSGCIPQWPRRSSNPRNVDGGGRKYSFVNAYEGCSFCDVRGPAVCKHIVRTCIKRNCKSYPLTMHKFVLTSLAIWLFDMIKNVMSSTVPEKKMDPRAEHSPQGQGRCDLPKGAKHPGSGLSPHSPYWLDCMWFLVVPHHQRKVGRTEIFPAFRASQKQSSQSSMHCLQPTVKMPLNLRADDLKCVCEAEESTLKECEWW